MNKLAGRDSGPGGGRGRGVIKGPPRKDFPPSQNGIGKKGGLEDIRLLHTDSLIKEVGECNLTCASTHELFFLYF